MINILLLLLIVSPLVAIALIYMPKFSSTNNFSALQSYSRSNALISSSFILFLSSITWLSYNHHSVYFQGLQVFQWDTFGGISLVLFSITIFLGLSIPNLGFGNDMYLFVKVQQLKQQ